MGKEAGMKILHRYILSSLIRNISLCLLIFTLLFLMIDFFDRIDNIIGAGGDVWASIQYFLYKIPLVVNLMLPLATLVATLFTYGLLSKNSELTAMRASGASIFWLARPLFILSLALSFFSMLMNETLVPLCTRRVSEIYNIDIQRKDQMGAYSQSEFWWRNNDRLVSIDIFDSRTNEMHGISIFDLDDSFDVARRTDAKEGYWIDPTLGWSMRGVTEYQFFPNREMSVESFPGLPLAITVGPEEFYDVKTDSKTMSYRSLRKYIKKQAANGVPTVRYQTDLHEKLAFPFVTFIACFVSLPFALKPARSGSLAVSFIAGLIIGFTYYVVHSYSIALGRAEFLPPFIAAWTANVVMGCVGMFLNLGAEAPN